MSRDLSQPLDGERDLGPEENMRMAVRHAEKGEEVSIASFRNFNAIQPGKTLRLYRFADRDVARGEPTVLEMHILTTDPHNFMLTFQGTYKSTKQNLNIQNGSCTIHPNGAVTISPNQKNLHTVCHGKHRVLIFEDEAELDVDASEEPTVHNLRTDVHDGIESAGSTDK